MVQCEDQAEIDDYWEKLGALKIGFATCGALINEAKIFAKILQTKGLESFAVSCKVGSTDKTEVGVGGFESRKGLSRALCNPVCRQIC